MIFLLVFCFIMMLTLLVVAVVSTDEVFEW